MQHLDEGTIHAWLDGQLPRDEALEVEAHVAECRPCADAVAEARGLVAASSRILLALDNVPREVLPKAPSSRVESEPSSVVATLPSPQSPAQQRAYRRWFRGGTLAAAAVIVVAIGTVAVMRAKDQRLARMVDLEVASRSVAGPALDSSRSVAPSAAGVPAPISTIEPTTTALGAGSAIAKERDAAPPSSTPAGREQASANELRRAPEEAVRSGQRAEGKKTLLEKRQLADAASNSEPAVARAQVQQRGQVAALNKPTDELAKDKKQELQAAVRRDGFASARDSRASNDTGSLDRSRVLEAAAPAAKAAAVGGVRGRVVDGNNTGLSGVMVTVAGTTTGGLTNDVGEFTLGGLPAGPHQINVRRVGYTAVTRDVTVPAGETVSSENIVLNPSPVELNSVVVTGTASAQRDRAKAAAPSPVPAAPPSATAQTALNAKSTAAGCYDLSITPTSAPSRTGFRQMPRSVALDSEVTPATAEGVWYRARDLAKIGALPNGVWRPTGPESFELTWTYGTRTAQIFLSGPAGSMLRGTIQEIDRATATGEAGAVVTIRRACR